MLHSKKSKNKSQWKFVLVLPILLAFVYSLNTKIIAQPSKKTKMVKIESEIFAQLISKNTDKNGLDAIKKTFEEKGLIIRYGNIKRNKDNKIASIKIDAKTKNGKATASYASIEKEGINPIKISFDSKNNNISIGSAVNSELNWYSVSHDNHKIIKKKIKSEKENFAFISNDDDETYEVTIDNDDSNDTEEEIRVIKGNKGGNNFVFISDKDGAGTPLYIIDSKKVSNEEFEKVLPDTIEKIEVLKGNKATEKYGKEAKDGVVIITTKKE